MKRRTFRVEAAQSLDEFLSAALKAPAEALITTGAVYVGGRRCRVPKTRLRDGDAVVVVLEESGRRPEEAPAPPSLRILYEDDALIAVDKPAGVPAQPTVSRVGASLVDQVSAHLGRTAGLVHRLDLETSGVMLFGKTKRATTALAAAFREGSVEKRYLAVTGPGLPERGTIDLPLSKDPSRPGRWRATRAANGIPAVTDYERLFGSAEYGLVALHPRTGRTHQLRAHLTALGAPILGDRRYGGLSEAAGIPARRCLLHASAVSLRHPTSGAPLRLEAPLPGDLERFFVRARR